MMCWRKTTTMPANRVLVLLLLSTLGFSPPCLALAMDSSGSGRRVLVTGAGGQTGQHVFRKLLAKPGYIPIGTVRSEASKKTLIESGNVPPENVVVCDITQGGPKLDELIKDCDAVMICTSAKPAPTGEVDDETKRPKFGFPNGEPEIVDWGGQKNLIDAATATNKCHVIICSSMGGTNPNHMLNSLGKTMNADGTSSGGDILKWKRKAEVYLIESGLPYTIVHPGGLLNEPGNERELCLGVDDTVQGTSNNSIPREDVANVMIAALENDKYRGRSFDLVSKPVGDGMVTTDYVKLVESLEGKNCDYKLGVIA